MSKKRKHYHSITPSELKSGPHSNLGGNWFVKKSENENHFYLQMSSSCYQEVSPDCFKATLERSSILPVEQIKHQLKQFNEVYNGQKKN